MDPYYLTHKAEKLGYIPQVILSGRRINNGMGKFIAQRCIKEMVHAGHSIAGCSVTILGLTFKEDCPDLRNSKVIDIIRELEDYDIKIQVHDALADSAEAVHEYGVSLTPFNQLAPASAVIVAVAHAQYRALDPKAMLPLLGEAPVLIDVKGIYDATRFREQGIRTWRL